MVINGWALLFHEALIGQVKTLANACRRARRADAKNFRSNANVKLFAALAKLLLEISPIRPGPSTVKATRSVRRIGTGSGRSSSVGSGCSSAMTADRASSSTQGSMTNAACVSAVARAILMRCSGGGSASGNPPNEWAALVRNSNELPGEIMSTVADGEKQAHNGA
jgi:toxin YhaV